MYSRANLAALVLVCCLFAAPALAADPSGGPRVRGLVRRLAAAPDDQARRTLIRDLLRLDDPAGARYLFQRWRSLRPGDGTFELLDRVVVVLLNLFGKLGILIARCCRVSSSQLVETHFGFNGTRELFNFLTGSFFCNQL